MQARDVDRRIRELDSSVPGLGARWAAYEGALKAATAFYRRSGVYPHQVTALPGDAGEARSSGGHTDLFKLFLERFHSMLRRGGHAGVLVPAALNATEGCNCRPKDAGKVCTDGDQCKGQCMFERFDNTGKEYGKCSDTERVTGCWNIVQHGASKYPPRLPIPRKLPTCL